MAVLPINSCHLNFTFANKSEMPLSVLERGIFILKTKEMPKTAPVSRIYAAN